MPIISNSIFCQANNEFAMNSSQEVDLVSEAIQPEQNTQINNLNAIPEDSIDSDIQIEASIEELCTVQQFIEAMRTATLDNNDLEPDIIERLRNPPTKPLALDHDLALRTGIKLYLD